MVSLRCGTSVFLFKPRQNPQFGYSDLFGCTSILKLHRSSRTHLFLDGSLYIAEGEGRLTVAWPAQKMFQEAETVYLVCEPLLVESRQVIVRNISEAHRQPIVELLREHGRLPSRLNEAKQSVSKFSFLRGCGPFRGGELRGYEGAFWHRHPHNENG
ncbi:MAG: hypothetical protein J0G35_06090 [Acidobacteriales bacterium]|nr:hypothetical protein [Terriglobales bacterium]